ncbi:hypothetical protein [Bacillus sp. UNC438CL73TsuS30]|uniref:hypothetical protein n=1 Tax=Bacillus sp. UNC438CL73TsuS30 TaxID=1340434 RepID=UPI00047BA685|nr:hypothetical protein [Bacillus sp. UNC438CL73TsuS30]
MPRGRRATKEYAVYKGDELLVIGTARECAEALGVQRETIIYYMSAAYQRRLSKRKDTKNALVTVPLDDEDDES